MDQKLIFLFYVLVFSLYVGTQGKAIKRAADYIGDYSDAEEERELAERREKEEDGEETDDEEEGGGREDKEDEEGEEGEEGEEEDKEEEEDEDEGEEEDEEEDYEDEEEENDEQEEEKNDKEVEDIGKTSNDEQKDEEAPQEGRNLGDNLDRAYEDADADNVSATEHIYEANTQTGVINDLFEEDIMVDPDREEEIAMWTSGEQQAKRNALNIKAFSDPRWRNKILYYYIDRNEHTAESINKLPAAVAELEAATCIKFRELLFETRNTAYHVRVVRRSGCYSYVGNIRSNSGYQDLSIGNGCNYKGTIIHEFLHALGFWHEQSRPDRDNYITILFQNIQSGRESQFKKHAENLVEETSVPYDYDSVMHYSSKAFSANGKPTIQRKDDPKKDITRQTGLSEKDIKELNNYYGCPQSVTSTAAPTTRATTRKTTRKTPRTTPTTQPTTKPTTKPTVTPTIKPTRDKTQLTFQVRGVGCWKRRGNRDISTASVKIDGVEYARKKNGLDVVVVDGTTGKVEKSLAYSKYRARYLLKWMLRRLPKRKLVIVTTQHFSRNGRSLRYPLRTIGAKRPRVYYCSSYALIGWTGPGIINKQIEVQAYRSRGPAMISTTITFPIL